jgi:hypothetical protein
MNYTALTLLCASIVGAIFWKRYPFPEGDALLQMILYYRPGLYHALHWSWTAMLFTTPGLFFSMIFSALYIFVGDGRKQVRSKLPPFPAPPEDGNLHVVIGEVHHPKKPVAIETPSWLTIPARGLFTGMAIFGAIGTGKTTGCMRPFARQILSWRAKDKKRRVGGIVLEVKGDFCRQIRQVLKAAGREEDYIELGMDARWSYNPLHNDLDAFALAYSIANLLNNLYGRGKEPFWQQAYTNLVKFIIVLHRVVDDYVTLFNIYECAINPDKLKAKIQEGDLLFAAAAAVPSAWIVIDPDVYLVHEDLSVYKWETSEERMRTPYSEELAAQMEEDGTAHDVVEAVPAIEAADLADRMGQFEAVKRWFEHDWMRIDAKLRTSIVEGISVFLSLFDDNPRLKRIFCPPRECYDPALNADGRYGTPLPSFAEMIEAGKVMALNFPVGANAATSRAVGCMVKLDFQRAMLNRIPRMSEEPERYFRETLFLCDEYQSFATVGEADPGGDEKFFALSRQAKCIPIVATQSISSLRSTLPGEAWRTLLQTFRTKIFLGLSDDFSAKTASELCGLEDRMLPSYSLSESGQDVQVSKLTGKALAHKAGVTINKTFSLNRRPLFEAREFAELKNAQAIVLAYNGTDPLPAQRVFLKPYYLDVNTSYFDQLAAGLL